MTKSFAWSGDLADIYVILACVIATLSLVLLTIELLRGGKARVRRAPLWIALTGLVAVIALLAAVLRPVMVTSKGSLVGPKVIVLGDASRSMDLPGLEGTRRATAQNALTKLAQHAPDVRLLPMTFGEGALLDKASSQGPFLGGRPLTRSDLSAALEAIVRAPDERPSAIVVLSDGRLDRPAAEGTAAATRAALEGLDVPVHTIATATKPLVDASIRAVGSAGAAVAHQAFSLRITIGCTAGLDCEAVDVVARELREEGDPTPLASGTAHVTDGLGTVELPVTLDRAGARILQVEIAVPKGDELPENNTRYVTVHVARDRIRVLHVAGRPTYDVRALRVWLKSDTSVDVVAFFILRTISDNVHASSNDLALIPFPVDELFSVHLPSFDAVVLQDFNAAPYGLTKHLPALANYVQKGGGLIMVGGPDAFVPGHYGQTKLGSVLPVSLDIGDSPGVDSAAFIPNITEAGYAAPVLAPLLSLLGGAMPQMPGTNVVSDALEGATVLMTHPTRKTKSAAPMPVLALAERGSGRTIALTLDGSHRLLFSTAASSSAGRAHGAFWDALLGWLMRDSRFEPAVIEPQGGGCIAGEDTTLLLRPVAGQRGQLKLTIFRLGSSTPLRVFRSTIRADGEAVEIAAGKLEPGGYTASVEIDAAQPGASDEPSSDGQTKGPTTRRDFACERGGDEWADPRPDVERLQEIAKATGGVSLLATDITSIPMPAATQVATERHVSALLPPWLWTLLAAAALGLHWIVRRRFGLS